MQRGGGRDGARYGAGSARVRSEERPWPGAGGRDVVCCVATALGAGAAVGARGRRPSSKQQAHVKCVAFNNCIQYTYVIVRRCVRRILRCESESCGWVRNARAQIYKPRSARWRWLGAAREQLCCDDDNAAARLRSHPISQSRGCRLAGGRKQTQMSRGDGGRSFIGQVEIENMHGWETGKIGRLWAYLIWWLGENVDRCPCAKPPPRPRSTQSLFSRSCDCGEEEG